MGERRGACRDLVGKPKERDHFEDLDKDWRIILKCNYKNWDEEWTGLIRSG
jgi:hypothetical protein